ncbi:methylenetetrahydrofolate reductase C-terminal domain-containing protein [Pelobacter seleniigenes]|uniref:methylenetetrahydrofolate reductase C-terminal domain-containing protein n=1 Tax=Pelobacter seleniigenes TaxID=407188 RepID=UPI0004A6AC1D|nr:methylenetetrahydrofolate reductase C-terminal domain-containing protein [Pelobacter seleniigenes]
MIVSAPKDRQRLKELLRPDDRVFLIGCGSCATVCKIGGEEEVFAFQEWLETQGHEVTGSMVLNEACHIMRAARELRRFHGQVEEADVLLVLACGAGAQSISDCTDKVVLTGVDPMFLGNVRRYGQFEEKCSLCGDCLLNESAGICPVTTCAKGLLNGPCGGMADGQCETDHDRECAWVRIYQRLQGREQTIFSLVVPPKDWSRKFKPGQHQLRKTPSAGGDE